MAEISHIHSELACMLRGFLQQMKQGDCAPHRLDLPWHCPQNA